MSDYSEFEKWAESHLFNILPEEYQAHFYNVSLMSWNAARKWKKATIELPKNSSLVLIKCSGEISAYVYTFCNNKFEFKQDDYLIEFSVLENIEWQYLPD